MTRLPLLILALLLLAAPAAADEVWEKQLGEKITAVATDEYGDRIFVGTESGMLYCYDSAGSVVWSVQVTTASGNPEIADIEIDSAGGYILVRGSGDPYGSMQLRDVATGNTIWDEFISTTDTVDVAISQGGGIAVQMWESPFHFRVRTPDNIWWKEGPISSVTDVAISGSGDWVALAKASDLQKYTLAIPDPDTWLHKVYNGRDRAWEYRIPHVISGSIDGAQTNYQIEIRVIRGSGTNSGNTTYLPDCLSDFRDIRFTADDGATELPFYRKSVVGSTATFIVNVPSIPASPHTETIYIYWGTPVAPPDDSDPDAAYFFYDDFEDGVIDTSKWYIDYQNPDGVLQETSGYLELKSPYGSAGNNGVGIRPQGKYWLTGHGRIEMSVNTLSTYDGNNRNLNTYQFLADKEVYIRDDVTHSTMQRYIGGVWSGDAATLDTYVTHNFYLTTTNSLRWIAGSDWDATTSTSYNRVFPYFGTSQNGQKQYCGHIRVDWVATSKWTPNEPTHGAWGTKESIFSLQDTKTLDGTIIDIDAPETGGWVAVSTTTKTYIIQITDTGFGTTYSTDRTGTPYQIQVADGGSFAIEGRNILADIFRIDAVQVGTYTTGGAVQHVAIAQKNGLYAAAGSDDGKYYVFSKDAASSWYLLHASDSYAPVTALAMSWRGELLIVGRADGRLTAFQVSEQDATGTLKLNVFRANKPYAAATLRIEESDDSTTWGAPITLTTDSYGSVALPVQWGNHYRITVGDGETGTILQASPIKTEYVIIVPSELPVRLHLDYSTEYDPATGDIWIRYVDDEAKTNAVTFRLYRTADNALEYEETFNTIPAGGLLTNHSVSWTNSSYRVQMSAVRDGQTITNTWHQWVGADVAALPGELDDGIRLGIWFIVILFVAGLFSYLTGPQGAVVTSLFAAFLVLIGWLPLEPAVVALCVVWAFLGLLGRTSAER